MKTVEELRIIELDGKSILGFNCLTKFDRRHDVPVYLPMGGSGRNLENLVAVAEFYRDKEGVALMAELSWLPASNRFAQVEDLWQRGIQLYANTFFRNVHPVTPIRVIDLDSVELQVYPGGIYTPAVFTW